MASADEIQKSQNFSNDIISQIIPIGANSIKITAVSILIRRIKNISEK